jgi:hypothetical protein
LKRTVLLSLILTACLCDGAHAADRRGRQPAGRTIAGTVYFTNNSPEENAFMVELFDGRTRRRVAAKWTEGQSGYFEFKGLRPGVYYLQVSGQNICLLQYELDARRVQPESLKVFGDAGCGHHQVAGLPAPRPVPRPKQR